MMIDKFFFFVKKSINEYYSSMSQIIHAQPVKKKITKELKLQCKELAEKGVIPFLKVVLVGKNPASVIYTNSKKKYCEKIGAKCEIVTLDENISETSFLQKINEINQDSDVDGCIIQLPLPNQLKHLNVGSLVDQKKDVDGFHPENLYAVLSNQLDNDHFVSCTPKGVITLLQENNIEVKGKHAVIIGRSMIVGKPLAMLLTNLDATVTLCHTKTENLKKFTQSADIIVCATGAFKFFDRSYLNSNKNQILVDVGISSDAEGHVCGDVNFDDVVDHVAAITPVPGGVGPMTIVSLAQNLLQASKKRLSL